MKRGSVDFTFLHRIEEVELNIRDERWQSALALALTLPDICGGIAFPDLVKKYRDGRVMLDRQKNPTRDVGSQYIRWFDEYAAAFFKVSPEDEAPYICGERCWQLRCEYLHQNKGFLNDSKESEIHFHLGINCGTSVCQMGQTRSQNGMTDIRIDIEQFCNRMCQAAKTYYNQENLEKDFSLYHTPVLDFIQVRQGTRTNPLILILCENPSYAEGLKMLLEPITNQVLVCENKEEAKKKLGKRKPALQVIREREELRLLEKNNGKPTVLKLPIEPQKFREVVRDYFL
jgi:hypothetical protein